jgi:hypothetical protein
MPVNKSKLDQLNAMMDTWLQERADKQARRDAKKARRDGNDDPVQYHGSREEPAAEPPTMPQEDSAPRRSMRDLFK